MEPFKITCVTCQARLSVRNEALIGQIIACPKCGSMVQVMAPARGVAAAGAAGAASALGVAGTSSIIIPTPGAQSASASMSAKPAVAKAPSAPVAAPVAPTPFDHVADFGADLESKAPPPVKAAAASRTATAAPRVGGLSISKIAAIVVGSALAGSTLVAGALALLGGGSEEANTTSAVPPAVGAADVDQNVTPTTIEPPGAPSNDVPAPASAADAPIEKTASTEAAIDGSGIPSLDGATPPDALTTNVSPAAPTAPGADAGPPAAADVPAADAHPAVEAAPKPQLRIDPLDLDPEGLDLSSLLHGPSVDPLAGSDAATQRAPVESEAAPPPAAGADAPPAARPAVERHDPVDPPAAPKVLLARQFASVKVDAMPLARFLDFATALSAMPVSVDPTELRLAAVSSSTAVSVNASNATIESLLTDALKPLRLEPKVERGQIVLKRTIGDQRRELTYPVGDLVGNDAAPLVGWVQALVAPESWKAAGGEGTATADGVSLKLNQSERVGYETILFLERYRAVLGLPPQSKYPAALLTSWAGVADLKAPLAAPATFTFSRPTTTGEVFRWWQGESTVAVLVDWPALESMRIAPQTRITASATGKPWGEAMTSVLEPLGLGWRPVDARTIEITSLDKMRTEPVVELYRIGAGASLSGDGILQKVASLAAEGQGGAQAAHAAAFYDDVHRVLMVRQGAAVQRRVADWLAGAGLVGKRD